MSVLKIIAIAGILLGVVALAKEKRDNTKSTKAIYVTLVVISALLLIVSGKAESVFNAQTEKTNAAIEAAGTENSISNTNNAAANGVVAEKNDVVAENTAETNETADANNADKSDNAEAKAPETPAPAEAKAPEAPAPAEAKAPEAPAPAEAPKPAAEAKAPAAPKPAAAPIDNDALAPIPDAGKDIPDGKQNEALTFSAKKSKKNPKGSDITSYAWDFGDGSTADTAEAKHAYAQIGTYVATLTVTDADGRSAKAVRNIDINRPENKIKFIMKKLDDANEVTATPSPFTGTATKTFPGSHMNIDATGYMLASDGCTCEIVVNIKGPGCGVTKSKKLQDGGEGNLSVKASCKGEIGEYTYTVTRKVTGSCACTFTGVTVDVNEG